MPNWRTGRYASATPLVLAISFLAFAKADASSNYQVAQLLVDLPQLREVVVPDGPIWKWLGSAFDGSNMGADIQWDPRETPASTLFNEETIFPDSGNVIRIRVNSRYKSGLYKGCLRSDEEVLSGLVYELCNSREWMPNLVLTREARRKLIDKQAYILRTAETEYSAKKARVVFYSDLWAPYCEGARKVPHPRLWGIPLAPTFGEWVKRYPSTYWYPWQYYGDRYDRLQRTKTDVSN